MRQLFSGAQLLAAKLTGAGLIVTLLLAAAIAAAAVLAALSIVKRRKKSKGKCAGCGGSCTGCIGCSVRQRPRSEDADSKADKNE